MTVHVISTWQCGDGVVAPKSVLVVKNADGKIVGTGKAANTSAPVNTTVCDMTATVGKVPPSAFYTVELENGTRLVTANKDDISGNTLRIIATDTDVRIGTCEDLSKDGALHYTNGYLC
jgi:hypothetical protein